MRENEWLSPPPWRNRTTDGRRGKAIGFTFACYALAGAVFMTALLWLLGWIGVPGWVTMLAWLVPTVLVTLWALRTNTPALIDELESQPWTEYVLRTVMVGSERPRPRPARLVTGIVLGAPVAYGAILLLVLNVIGIA